MKIRDQREEIRKKWNCCEQHEQVCFVEGIQNIHMWRNKIEREMDRHFEESCVYIYLMHNMVEYVIYVIVLCSVLLGIEEPSVVRLYW